MKDGFFRVAAATPKIKVGNVPFNANNIISRIKESFESGAKLVVFPELCLTGYTAGDLFLSDALIKSAKKEMLRIADITKELDILIVVGMPFELKNKLYNVAVFIKDGKVLGIVPKTNIPNYSEFYELRHFNSFEKNIIINLNGKQVPFGTRLLFSPDGYEELVIGCEICEDLWVSEPPAVKHCLNGANLIVNLSASDETVGKAEFRRMLVKSFTARTISAYVYSDAGDGESTTDVVFGGHNIIGESGNVLAESNLFSNGIVYADVDINKVNQLRKKVTTFKTEFDERYITVTFNTKICETKLSRRFNSHPFVPKNDAKLAKRCEDIFTMQYSGLKKRIEHIGLKTVTLGISGGLDSTLALLVTAKAFDSLGLDRKGIIAVTMPCFGTTERTYNNAKELTDCIGATLREVKIAEAVTVHMKDIGASLDEHDVTYENAQARERTQVLMDIANKTGGIVIGTGDLSELALGFATYNGDHMSMYGVNCSIPKTLVRYLVKYVADNGNQRLKSVLYSVLDTPVSPELLPPDEAGSIKQKTEEIVGPYELHDFFLYNFIRFEFSKEKILRMAENAFEGKYSRETIEKYLNVFFKKFYANQFKRSAIPDGPKVGTVSLSPRGDWRMPSDAEM